MKRAIFIAILFCAAPSPARAQSYPSTLDTDSSLIKGVDNKFTYLTAAITNTASSIAVASTAGVPSAGALQIDSELMAYSAGDATHFAVTRASYGTSAAAHAQNATVRFPLVAAHVNNLQGAVKALEAKVGVGSSDASAASTGYCQKKNADGTTSWQACASGSGTVTSVGLSLPAEFDVTGSPVTSNGTLAAAWAAQAANKVFAGPGSGADAAPAFRALVEADVPALSESKITGLASDLLAKLTAANNLSDLTSPSTARTNLGLGTTQTVQFGSVGVGTSPAATLHVAAAGNRPAYFDGSASATGLGSGIGFVISNTDATANNRAGLYFADHSGGGSGSSAWFEIIFTNRTGHYGSFEFDTRDSDGAHTRLSLSKSVVVGEGALSTSATDGFLYIPSSAGAPAGTATSYAGRVPLTYDTLSHRLCVYDAGWRCVQF